MPDICVIVIGLGSMGKRRIRLIRKYDKAIKIVGIDANEKRCGEAEKELSIIVDNAIKNAVEKYAPSCAFVCTSPLSHSAIISECLDYNLNVFTELNLVSDGYEDNIRKAEEGKIKIFMSSTFQYREEIRYIGDCIKKHTENINYIYHVGQYLPDWHPWENYKDFFVSNPRSNGCREILAIDLPWLISAFGEVENFTVQKRKSSGLEVNYNDTYQILLQHKSGTMGVLAVDVISRKAVRNLEIYSEHFYLEWNGSPYGLKEYDISSGHTKSVELYHEVDKNSQYSDFVIENMYLNEIKAFFEYVYQGKEPLYSLKDDFKVLAIIDQIEEQL